MNSRKTISVLRLFSLVMRAGQLRKQILEGSSDNLTPNIKALYKLKEITQQIEAIENHNLITKEIVREWRNTADELASDIRELTWKWEIKPHKSIKA